MNRAEQERLSKLFTNPPRGSKIAAAKEFGVDLSLTLRSLAMTPTERSRAMQDALQFAESLRTPDATTVITDFERAIRTLADAGVRFIVVGAYAAYAQGANQLTRDLDICYERSPANLKKLAETLAPLHPHLRDAPESIAFVLDQRALASGMNFTLHTDLGDIDLMGELSGVGQFSELAKDAVTIILHDRKLSVASLDAIIRSKKAAGRPKDLLVLPELETLKAIQSADKKNKSNKKKSG